MNVIVDESDLTFTILSSQYWFLEVRKVSAYGAQGLTSTLLSTDK